MAGPLDDQSLEWLERTFGPLPDLLVETGTGYGQTAYWAMTHFRLVRSVELSRDLHAQALAAGFGPNVELFSGDSADQLPRMLADSPWRDSPVLFYLDAHWSGGRAGRGQDDCPLLRELRVIRDRPCPDVIVCDDVRMFGLRGEAGLPGSEQYPLHDFDWSTVTVETCREILGPDTIEREALAADRFIVRRTNRNSAG
jgi:hypothetical protein